MKEPVQCSNDLCVPDKPSLRVRLLKLSVERDPFFAFEKIISNLSETTAFVKYNAVDP